MSAFRIWRISVAIALAAPVLLSAEKKPKTPAEAKAEFAKADKALNESWTTARKGLGWFSDKGREKEKAEETNLVFVTRARVLFLTDNPEAGFL